MTQGMACGHFRQGDGQGGGLIFLLVRKRCAVCQAMVKLFLAMGLAAQRGLHNL